MPTLQDIQYTEPPGSCPVESPRMLIELQRLINYLAWLIMLLIVSSWGDTEYLLTDRVIPAGSVHKYP